MGQRRGGAAAQPRSAMTHVTTGRVAAWARASCEAAVTLE
jgi:hypothetical protein